MERGIAMAPKQDEGESRHGVTPGRWQRVEQLYHAAVDRPAAERQDFLESACAGDDPLRRDVESLLAAEAGTGEFMQSLPADLVPRILGAESPAPDLSANASPDTIPMAIGTYRILRLLGAGGMGAVYEAEQQSPHRTVALKIIQPGFTTPELLRRFKQEANALGKLQHPGIAQIHEASTADTGLGPQPYFAMELIRGPSLTEYAETHRLKTRERLELLAKICDAVQHAHQRGIIHRDLKPANILVDETGQPKILDFGVARVVDSEWPVTRQTDLGELVGTLAYMSPEQITAEPFEVDTRSDVYALGVILYQLLAGRLPYQGGNLNQIVQVIREQEAPPLGSVSRAYRGDIETIAAKALEKEKARRYASAADFAADIRRYLGNEPITARPPSGTYQLRKFAKRHTAVVSGTAVVFLVLTAGIIASTSEAARANRAGQAALRERDRATAAGQTAIQERDRAQRAEQAATTERNRAVAEARRADTESATAKAVRDFLLNDLLAQAGATAQAGPNMQPDPDLKVRTALDRAVARMPGKFDKRPLVEAAIRQTIGDAYWELGLYSDAERQTARAIELRERYLGRYSPDALSSRNKLGEQYIAAGKFNEAEKLFAEVAEARARVLGPDHPDTLSTMANLAFAYGRLSRYVEAERLASAVLKRQLHLLGERNPETLNSMNNLAQLYMDQGKFPQAEEFYTQFVSISPQVLGTGDPRMLSGMNNLAQLYRRQGKLPKAEELLLQVLEMERRVLGTEHRGTASTMNDLALVFRQEGKYRQAEDLYANSLQIHRRVLGEENPLTLAVMENLGVLYRDQSRDAEAEAAVMKVLEIRRRVLGNDHRDTLASLNSAAVFSRDHGKYPEAESLFLQVVAGFRRVLGDQAANTLTGKDNLAVVIGEQGRYSEAELLLKEVVEGRRRLLGSDNSYTLRSMNNLAVIYREERRHAEAESLFLQALEGRRTKLGPEHPDTLTTMNDLALLYETEGKYGEAQEFASALLDTRRTRLGSGHRDTANAMTLLGRIRLRQSRYAEADALFREALVAYTATTPESWRRYDVESLLGAALSRQESFQDAESLLVSGYRGLLERRHRMPAYNAPSIAQAGDRIVELYQNWGKPDQAAEWRKQVTADREKIAGTQR
jgi:serine/threonine protein kinase